MQKILIGLTWSGFPNMGTAVTEMYVTPKGLFPVLGEPITITKEIADVLSGTLV